MQYVATSPESLDNLLENLHSINNLRWSSGASLVMPSRMLNNAYHLVESCGYVLLKCDGELKQVTIGDEHDLVIVGL